MNNEMTTVAMQMILHAGDARTYIEEANGMKHELYVLFIHAQDTLMTIKSEYELARQLIEIFESIDERLKKVGV